MSVTMETIAGMLAESLDRQQRIEAMLSQLLGQQPAPPVSVGRHNQLRALAKVDPQASIALAKALAKQDTANRAQERRAKRLGVGVHAG